MEADAAVGIQRVSYDSNWTVAVRRPFPRPYDYQGPTLPFHPEYRESVPILDALALAPDHWCKSTRLRHRDIATEPLFNNMTRSLERWSNFLNVPMEKVFAIREGTVSLAKSLEIMGPLIPMSLVVSYAQLVVKNWPSMTTRDDNGEKVFPTGDTPASARMMRFYGAILHKDFKASNELVGWQKWVYRRTKYKSLSKLSSILDNLAEEMGTVSFGWFASVQTKLDLILSMRTFTMNGGVVVNDYSTDFQEWVVQLHSIPPSFKKIRGEMIKFSNPIFKLNEEEYQAMRRLRESMEPGGDLDLTGSDSGPSDDDESDSSSFNGGNQLNYQGHLSLSEHSNDSAVWSDENMMSDDE